MSLTRRAFLSTLSAPAIVRATSLMPVRGLIMAVETFPQIAGIYLAAAREDGSAALIRDPNNPYDLDIVRIKQRDWFRGDPVMTTDVL